MIVDKHKSPRSYLIDTGSNVIRRNSNHLKKSVIKHEITGTESDNELLKTSINQAVRNNINDTQDESDNDSIVNTSANNVKDESVKENVRPTRAKTMPSKFNNYVLY